jgi:hypothetical protein
VHGQWEGPLVTLGWGGTQGPVNELFYEVYAGTDSLQVLNRSAPMLQRSVFTRFLTHTPWPTGQRVYWAVTSEHAITHERLVGPVQSFQVMDGSVPVETRDIFVRDFGSVDIRNRNFQFCSRNTIPVGPSFNGAIHWEYTPLPPDARVVSVTMSCWFPDVESGRFNGVRPVTLWMSQNEWQACNMTAPGPPYNEPSGELASGVEGDPARVDFSSPRLGAFVEAQARNRTLVTGLVLRGKDNFNFHSPNSATPSAVPRMTVRYQRVPAGVTP